MTRRGKPQGAVLATDTTAQTSLSRSLIGSASPPGDGSQQIDYARILTVAAEPLDFAQTIRFCAAVNAAKIYCHCMPNGGSRVVIMRPTVTFRKILSYKRAAFTVPVHLVVGILGMESLACIFPLFPGFRPLAIRPFIRWGVSGRGQMSSLLYSVICPIV